MDEDITMFALLGGFVVFVFFIVCFFITKPSKKYESADGTVVNVSEKSVSESGTYEYVIVSE